MKSFTLHLRLILSLLFLLLTPILCTLWYRSHHGPDVLKYTSPNQWYLGLISGHGTVDVLYIANWPGEPEFRITRYDSQVYYGTRYGNRFLGFGSAAQHNGGRFVNIPHWFLVTCAMLAAAIFFRSWRRAKRKLPSGRCRVCDYDLRATPARCPECGTPSVATGVATDGPR